MTAYNVINRSALVADQPEDISVVLANLDAIAAVINGGLDNTNLAAAAAIALSKLGQSGASTGQYVQWNGTAWVPAALPITFETSIPGSPTDGQEVILMDSLTAPTYAWHLKYRSAISDAYKWVYLGGSPLVTTVDGTTSFTVGALTNYSALGSTIVTAPRAGVYVVEYAAGSNSSSNDETIFSYSIAGGAPSDADGAEVSHYGSTNEHVFNRRQETLAASDTVELKVKAPYNPGNVDVYRKRISLTPVRVS